MLTWNFNMHSDIIKQKLSILNSYQKRFSGPDRKLVCLQKTKYLSKISNIVYLGISVWKLVSFFSYFVFLFKIDTSLIQYIPTTLFPASTPPSSPPSLSSKSTVLPFLFGKEQALTTVNGAQQTCRFRTD